MHKNIKPSKNIPSIPNTTKSIENKKSKNNGHILYMLDKLSNIFHK